MAMSLHGRTWWAWAAVAALVTAGPTWSAGPRGPRPLEAAPANRGSALPAVRVNAGQSPLRVRLAWQIALDRSGFSGGIIDGKIGPKVELATREFQRAHGLEATGVLDAATATALSADPDKALTTYTVTAADLEKVGTLPKEWAEKAALSWLPYPSLDEALAEKFHCTRALLSAINDGRNIAALEADDVINVPGVEEQPPPPAVHAGRMEISLGEKVIRLYGSDGRQIGLLHCSIAADKANLPPVPQTSVAKVAVRPTYWFDPAKWPEVKNVDKKLEIPAGPRNPVGLCWVGLELAGYGIHGSPTPELIGKTGSHGCFRLTNWDAVRLGKTVRVGMPVTFTAGGRPEAAGSAVAAGGEGTDSAAERPAPPAESAVREVAPTRAGHTSANAQGWD
jgi:lipoprotein-anchoring transpeptidase ErfK/SrfK